MSRTSGGCLQGKSRARLLVLTHFTQRYGPAEGQRLATEAEMAFGAG